MGWFNHQLELGVFVALPTKSPGAEVNGSIVAASAVNTTAKAAFLLPAYGGCGLEICQFFMLERGPEFP